jgi:predicted permease
VAAGTVFYSGKDFIKSQPRQAAFVNSVINDLSTQPGVTAVAAIDPLPFDPHRGGSSSFAIVGRPLGPNDPGPHSDIARATADYLKVMQIPLLAGRWISPEDRADTEPVVVIDERLAKKFWPNENPVGQQISGLNDNKPTLVIGVVANVRGKSLEEDTSDGMRYYAMMQAPNFATNFVARTAGDPNVLTPAIQRSIASADGTQTASDIQPLESLVSESLAGRRLIVDMLAAFAGLALVLAVVGIYGLISFITSQRTNEVGIRIAVGAQRFDVVRLVMGDALSWVAVGLAIGVVLSFVANTLLEKSFAGFGGGMFSSLGLAVLALFVVGIIAALLPALRAASIEPIQALRNE